MIKIYSTQIKMLSHFILRQWQQLYLLEYTCQKFDYKVIKHKTN